MKREVRIIRVKKQELHMKFSRNIQRKKPFRRSGFSWLGTESSNLLDLQVSQKITKLRVKKRNSDVTHTTWEFRKSVNKFHTLSVMSHDFSRFLTHFLPSLG
jgi:hypothetical protein